MVKKYLIKRSQVVAILIFLVEIIGSLALIPQILRDAAPYCYLFERKVAVQ